MSCWLFVGSSATAKQGLRRALQAESIDKTITTNRGILLLPRPGFYFLTDGTAVQRWINEAKAAQKAGTLCLTLQRDSNALALRDLNWCDEFIRQGHPYEPFRMSGLWSMEYALRHGATRLVLVGCDGYRGNGRDYFHMAADKADGGWTERIIQPETQRLVEKYPCEWVCYGRPVYTISHDRWAVCPAV